MKRLNMTKEAAFKDEAEQSSHLSDSGKENFFFMELKIVDQQRLEPITQGLETDRNGCKSTQLGVLPDGHQVFWNALGPPLSSSPLFSTRLGSFRGSTEVSDLLKVTWFISKFWIGVLAPGALSHGLSGKCNLGIHLHYMKLNLPWPQCFSDWKWGKHTFICPGKELTVYPQIIVIDIGSFLICLAPKLPWGSILALPLPSGETG